MKYALIGCGRIAVNHIKAAMSNHLELAAICDLEMEQMEKLLIKYNLEDKTSIKRYTDYKEMISLKKCFRAFHKDI